MAEALLPRWRRKHRREEIAHAELDYVDRQTLLQAGRDLNDEALALYGRYREMGNSPAIAFRSVLAHYRNRADEAARLKGHDTGAE